MAKAKVKITKPKKVKTKIVLELTEKEARALYNLLIEIEGGEDPLNPLYLALYDLRWDSKNGGRITPYGAGGNYTVNRSRGAIVWEEN